MIQKITSSKIELPPIWLVETKEDWDKLPIGLPRIIASISELNFIRTYLEFQTLLKSCNRTGLPIKWLDMLTRIGYKGNFKEYVLSSGGEYDFNEGGAYPLELDDFIEDQYLVNFDRLAELKILPVWLDDLKSSIETNIINEVIFDPTAFNKQLGMNIGAGSVRNSKKNLLILDVSGSIPKGVVITITNLAKLMSKKFYADVMITSGKTILIDYDNVPDSDIIEIAKKSGCGNEGVMYKELVEQPRSYNTIIAFGDNDHPKHYGSYGELKSKWDIETIYSLHIEKTSKDVVGYARFLTSKNSPILVHDWVQTLNK